MNRQTDRPKSYPSAISTISAQRTEESRARAGEIRVYSICRIHFSRLLPTGNSREKERRYNTITRAEENIIPKNFIA